MIKISPRILVFTFLLIILIFIIVIDNLSIIHRLYSKFIENKIAPFTYTYIYYTTLAQSVSYNNENNKAEIINLPKIQKEGVDTVLVKELITFYSSAKYGDLKGRNHNCLSRYDSSRSQFLISAIQQRMTDLCCYEYAEMADHILRKFGYITKLVYLKSHVLNSAHKQNETLIIDLTYGLILKGDFFTTQPIKNVFVFSNIDTSISSFFYFNRSILINKLLDHKERKRLVKKVI